MRYSADKAILGVCIWHGQYKVGGDGTVSLEQENPSFSPEIQSTSFDSSPLSPKVTSKRLVENRSLIHLRREVSLSPLAILGFLHFISGDFSFPCHTNSLNYAKHEAVGFQDWKRGGEKPHLHIALLIWYPRLPA